MADFTVVYTMPIDGLGYEYRFFDGATIFPCDQFGTPVGDAGPVNDSHASSGWVIEGENDVGQLFVASAPDGIPGTTPLEDPVDYSLVDGATWVMEIGLTTEAAAPSEEYLLDTDLLDHGYTMTVGLGTLIPTDAGYAISVVGDGTPIATATSIPWMQALVDTGYASLTSPVEIGVLPESVIDSMNAGDTTSYVRIFTEGLSTRHPMLYVAELRLHAIRFTTGLVATATRQFPRDDTLGLGSATRIHPPPRSGRIAGGHQ